jgi:glutathione S-transferase
MLGADYSLVDLLLANAVKYGSMCGATTEAHAHVGRWLERCLARPALRAEWS